MKKPTKRTPIVEKKIKPGENLPPTGPGVVMPFPSSAPTASGHARMVTPPRPPPVKVDRELLDRALLMRGELNRATDELNAKIADAEKAIVALKLGVSGSVILAVDGDRTDQLTFSRHHDAWRLTYDVTNATGTEKTPLLSASRAQRLRAVPFFAALVNELADAAVREIAKVEEAREKYRAFAEAVEASKVTE